MKILVPLDGSTFAEAILEPVTQLARAMDAEVHLVAVVGRLKDDGIWTKAPTDSAAAAETVDAALHSAEDYLARIAGRFPPGRVRVKAVPGNDPVQGILALSRDEGVDMVAMSTRGRSGLGRWVYGSTADKVLYSVSIPLLLLRPREKRGTSLERGPVDGLVVPLDGSELAEAALPHAEELARKMALKLSLIRVVPQIAMAYPVGEHYAYDPRLDIEMENAAVSYLQERRAELERKGLQVECQVKRGNAAAAVIDFAEDRGSSLIVMSTHGRSGIGRWLIGSVADRVLRASFSPVLLIRSQGAGT